MLSDGISAAQKSSRRSKQVRLLMRILNAHAMSCKEHKKSVLLLKSVRSSCKERWMVSIRLNCKRSVCK